MKTRRPLEIGWLPENITRPGKLGIARLPGWSAAGGSLPDDLEALQSAGIRHVVPLVTDDELAAYHVDGLCAAYQQAGFTVRRLPIPDMGVSSLEEMTGLVAWLDERLRGGAGVLVHCVGGLGRSGMAAACYLAARGLDPEAAIAAVRRTRSPHAVETVEQESFVCRFADSWWGARGVIDF